MAKSLLASDRVLLLLALVPYLREHGPTPIAELGRTFDVEPRVLRRLISFLGTAGIPGETLSYQHNDLFDIDWDEFEERDTVSLTHTVAIDETPRFTGAETAALLAGLAALRPLLNESDAIVASALGERLGSVMGATTVPSVAVSQADSEGGLSLLVGAIERGQAVRFRYLDAAGNESERTVRPEALDEREGVWYLHGFNVERGAARTFSVAQMSGIEEVAGEAAGAAGGTGAVGAAEPRVGTEILAIVPLRLLPAIRGFAPEEVAKPERAVPAGCTLVRFEAWHAGAAVRLAQHGPGEIEIVSPPAARAAVSEWAEAALFAYGE
ncbi:proteasome accessory factor C [Leucobacter komagatae]|uniref:Proteasome accessory factor C n=1 Tax=Leucobacter komagatae TaxID=55969 RepID=A0A542Y2U1_9MICO|nr:WYL domain-containing protein [Leucobacter komagatae]TQL42398.1 proteasome accessory factor C [Leucobacter komagatae]